jgi:hypothetical protein
MLPRPTAWRAIVFALLVPSSVTVTACQLAGNGSSPAPASSTSPPGSSASSDAGTGPDAAAPLVDDGSCATDADCEHGEYCNQGQCQIQLCGAQAQSSVPPLGKHRLLEPLRDVLVVDDATSTLGAYDPANAAATGDSWSQGGKILAVAGGDFYGEPGEAIALAVQGHQGVTMIHGGASVGDVAVGFQPIGVAAGDVDADGIDELVALGAAGEIALCHPSTQACDAFSLKGETGIDVTAADVDGDGFAEPVFLVSDASSASTVVVWNVDSAKTGQPQTVAASTGATLMAIAAGDIAGTGVAALLGLEDGGWVDLVADHVHVYDASGATITESASVSVADDSTAFAAGVDDGGTRAGVLVLTKSNTVQVYSPDLVLGPTLSLGTTNATRVSLADIAGISPSVTLEGDAQLVAGRIVPTALLLYPPYSALHSDGTSTITVGNSQSQSQSVSDSVGVTASVGAGFEVDIPDVVKAGISDSIASSMTLTRTAQKTVTIQNDYSVQARPDMSGPDNAAVILSGACFDAYTYRLDDPQQQIGGNGKHVVMFVPVDAQQTVWSLKRYAALAQARGDLPTLHVPYAVGDPSAYPAQAQTLEGSAIPTQDVVLSGKDAYRASDVARVGWQLTTAEQQGTTQATQISDTALGHVSVGPLSIQGEVGGSLGTSYSVALGEEIYFGGSVPPIKDDLAANGYSFAPIVYRSHFTDSSGAPGGYYVVTYSVGP